MLPHERPLLTDAQLKQASLDQIEDLVHRINLVVQERGLPGVVWRTPMEDEPRPSDPSDPFDPPTM
jgi:hypothetical protein